MSETVFTYGAPQLKFGPGASDEDLSGTGGWVVSTVLRGGVMGSEDGVPTATRAS